jgi:Protein of unknown function DUF262/Protein of unknown function (DUF1524)
MDISRVFTNRSQSVSDFFQQPGMGYYIPLYQREYSWDTENIDQLMEDICSGVNDVVEGVPDPIHFMGTLILVTENNPISNIKPLDQRALPSRVDNVIDGQQRISTITILACQLYQRLFRVRGLSVKDACFNDIKEAIDTCLSTLLEVVSVDLRRGSPSRKPIIIRASIDQWSLDGADSNYKSEISSYLAEFIRAIESVSPFLQAPSKSLVGKNIKRINQLLKDVEEAHQPNNPYSEFPPARQILQKFSEVDLWNYPRPDLVNVVNRYSNPISEEESRACSVVQLLAFCHYLLQRCCFTVIQPISDVRAFDMFQSLNATGTPLTAYETFKPLVVNHIESLGYSFKDSNSAAYLASVDRLLSSKRSASAKSKLTDDYLNLLELTSDGRSGSKQFSRQRDWLNKTYEKLCSSDSEKENFIRTMGDIADYLTNVVDYNYASAYVVGMQSMPEPDRGIASVCLLYLQKANHKMANTVLSRFYSQVLRNQAVGDVEFISACKAVAAFFTIWRSALPNAGLDDVYRKLLRDHISWKKGNSELNAKFLKGYFRDILVSKGIGTKADWLAKAKDYLRYDESLAICKFVLFVVAEDTIVDPTAPGLMKLGNRGATPPYLTPQRWVSEELKSIEHIAPQKPELRQPWDLSLYQNDDYQRIGNLALLPIPINSSLSNKGWVEKFIYYQHLAEKDPEKLAQLKLEAQTHGVTLNSQALELLTSTPVKQHMESIIQTGIMGVWDKNLVDRRSERTCDILWDRISLWIT